ncbi:hypothetical protein Y032_0566g23 [Ancylostoma ceylanicum]|uniref:Uncharacterized protein n=1 Tax=Ancylostoma ceylanicum TaxID=53326 RepID=A0A016WQI3_9BILA|nr:hypothetical protein Y032_0566g23 [Ancylostoma ceylanicum]
MISRSRFSVFQYPLQPTVKRITQRTCIHSHHSTLISKTNHSYTFPVPDAIAVSWRETLLNEDEVDHRLLAGGNRTDKDVELWNEKTHIFANRLL